MINNLICRICGKEINSWEGFRFAKDKSWVEHIVCQTSPIPPNNKLLGILGGIL